MKIREYVEYTLNLEAKFDWYAKQRDDQFNDELCRLMEAIDLRHEDVQAWLLSGLTVDDEVPESPKKLILPDFG